MGLTVSHGCWDGPYSKFHRFRIWVAKRVGISLQLMEGFQFSDHPKVRLEGGSEVDPISWRLLAPDPLYQFLTHPDDEGEIDPVGGLAIAERLEQVARDAEESGDLSWVEAARRFAKGLRNAAEQNENVTFW